VRRFTRFIPPGEVPIESTKVENSEEGVVQLRVISTGTLKELALGVNKVGQF
jgi:hypothetical protein